MSLRSKCVARTVRTWLVRAGDLGWAVLGVGFCALFLGSTLFGACGRDAAAVGADDAASMQPGVSEASPPAAARDSAQGASKAGGAALSSTAGTSAGSGPPSPRTGTGGAAGAVMSMRVPTAGMSATASGAGGMLSTAVSTAGMAATTGAGGMPASAMMSLDSGDPMPSPGCMGGSLMPGRSNGSIQSSGGNRTYIQYIPASYDGATPVPLVVDLHPFSVGASFAESSSGFRQLADTEGYMYLAPQGMSNMWDSVGDTDEKFIRDLVGKIAADGCIDMRRIYATGCSNGGAFTFLLMCTAEDIFAAVAPMCGTAFFDIEKMCMMDRPVSLMLRIGRQDTLNCWEGEGMVLNAPNVPSGTRVQCAKTVQKVFSEKYHCKGQIMMMDECEIVGDCDEGTEIAICDENTGHVVYTANTARDTWAFLKQFYKH